MLLTGSFSLLMERDALVIIHKANEANIRNLSTEPLQVANKKCMPWYGIYRE